MIVWAPRKAGLRVGFLFGALRQAPWRARPQEVLAILERYSKREISAQEAMNALDVRCLENLYGMTLEAGLGLPRIDREAAEKLAKRFLDEVRRGRQPR